SANLKGAANALLRLDPFGREHRVSSPGHWRTGHNADSLARGNDPVKRMSGHRISNDGQRQLIVSGCAFRAIGSHSVAIHRRAVEAWHVDVADDRRCEYPARGAPQWHDLRRQRLQLCVKPFEGGSNSVTLREATHPHVFRGSNKVAH